MKKIKRILVAMIVATMAISMMSINMRYAAEAKVGKKTIQIDNIVSEVQLGEEVIIEESSNTKYFKFIPYNNGYYTFYETDGWLSTIGIYDENSKLIRENSYNQEVTGYFEKDKVYYIGVDGKGKFSSYQSAVTNGIMEEKVQESFVIVVDYSGLYNIGLTDSWNTDYCSWNFRLIDITASKIVGGGSEINIAVELNKGHVYKIDIKDNIKTDILHMKCLRKSDTTWNGDVSEYFTEGSGTEEEPYQITSAQDLALLADEVNSGNDFKDKYFVMTADIQLNETENYSDWEQSPPEKAWTPIGSGDYLFAGKFNGNGHTISGMYIDGYADNLGLFGEVSKEAVIENVNICDFYLKNSYANLKTCMGGLVATNQGIIDNCKSMGRFTGFVGSVYQSPENNAGNSMGALIGWNEGKVTDCSNLCGNMICQVDNGCYWGYDGGVGGIVGHMADGIIANCYNKSQINFNVLRARIGSANCIGGISGGAHAGSIISCWNEGDMKSDISCYDDDSYFAPNSWIEMGGIAGCCEGKICNSYNKGNINCKVISEERVDFFSETGGIVGCLAGWYSMNGQSSYGELCNCYNVGEITNSGVGNVEKLIGELAGKAYSDNHINCSYWLKSPNNSVGNDDFENISDCAAFDTTQKLEKEILETEELCEALNNWFTWGKADKSSDRFYYRGWEKDAVNTGFPVFSEKIPQVLTAVEINTLPDKCTYVQGENFDKTGLSLLAIYADGETSVITKDELAIDSYDFSTQGRKTVKIHYKGFTVGISVSVITDSEMQKPTPTPTAKPTPAPTKTPSATVTPTPTNTPSVSGKSVSVENTKVAIKSVKNKKGKKVAASWKKVTGASGYQIAYSTNKKFKSKKTKNMTKTTVTLSKLKKKKTYYIKVRAYTKVNGKKVFGKWSAVKKVKVKK